MTKRDRLQGLGPGEQFVYSRGMRKLAWQLFMEGKILLVQRSIKLEDGRRSTEYIAIGATPPYKPVKFTGCYAPQEVSHDPDIHAGRGSQDPARSL